ncbi:MAG: glycosyltransferase [Lachnospiraceae bacterium]|nr:glycosyltransferase [Lachnospiraceae bacterium]
MKKIGIVIPVYNTEKYLRQCIESVLSQTYTNISVALVDDGSTDGSGQICDEYAKKDKRVKSIHQSNKGVLKAIIKGAEELECDYLTCVDSDDWILNNTYEQLSGYLEQNIDVISFNIIRYFSEDDQIPTTESYDKGIYDKNEIRSRIFPTMIWDIDKCSFGLDPSLCNKLIRKDFLIKYLSLAQGLDTNYGQDVAVIYPMMYEISSLVFTDGYYYYHRQRYEGETALYVTDQGFYRKTHDLFNYITDFYKNDAVLKMQCEYFYVSALEFRLNQLFGGDSRSGYAFPVNEIENGKRIVLFGAGNVGKAYFKQLKQTNYGKLAGWIDSNTTGKYGGCSIEPSERIKSIEFDYVVIATVNKNYRQEMLETLLKYGVERAKIIPRT